MVAISALSVASQFHFPNARHIGLISDTHGLLRQSALDALAGSDLIVHAGDVGRPEILTALEQIAPVVAVQGNIDTADWAKTLPIDAVVVTQLASLFVIHELTYHNSPGNYDIIISGHTHKPHQERRSPDNQHDVLYLNPGAAGPRRFRLPITVGKLNLESKPWQLELVTLEPGTENVVTS